MLRARELRLPVAPAPISAGVARWGTASLRGVVIVAGLLLLPQALNAHWTFLVASMFVYAIVLLSFVVLYGWLGQVSFVQAELMGVGAFTAAALTASHTVPTWLAALLAMAITVPTGLIVAVCSLRLRGVNVSLATLAFAVALDNFILNTQTVSRLDIGRASGRPGFGGHPLSDRGFYYLAAAVFLAAALALVLIRRSHLGRSFRAVRDSEVAAAASGLSSWKYKVLAWVVASALAGLGGALFAFLFGVVNFRPFGVTQSLFLFAVAVIGGVASVRGALLGGVFFIGVPELLGYLETTGKYTYLVFGLGVIAAVLFLPRGLAAIGEQTRRLTGWVGGRRSAAEVL